MNATQRLIDAVEEVFRLSQLDYDGIDILVQRAAANQEVKEALAAAKEERVLTMQDVMLACGELNKRERVAVQWLLDRCRPVKEEQQRSPHEQAVADAFQDCIGVGGVPSDAEFFAEFTQRLAVRLGIPAPAKGSGLTVDEVMEALDNVGRHEGWGIVTVAKGALRKALEAHAEKADGTK